MALPHTISDEGVTIVALDPSNLNHILALLSHNKLVPAIHNAKSASITFLTQYWSNTFSYHDLYFKYRLLYLISIKFFDKLSTKIFLPHLISVFLIHFCVFLHLFHFFGFPFFCFCHITWNFFILFSVSLKYALVFICFW